MERLFKHLCYTLAFASLLACNRNGSVSSASTGSSGFTIPAAKLAQIRASIPGGQTPCFGVSITGAGVTASSSQCSPSLGQVFGYTLLDASDDLTVPNVPIGTVNIDLYVYLLPAGSTGICPTMIAPLPAAQLANTYLVGSLAGVQVPATTPPTMTVNFTGQNVAQQNDMPASCTPGTSAIPFTPMSLAVGGGLSASNANNSMTHVRFGNAVPRTKLSGTGYTLIVR